MLPQSADVGRRQLALLLALLVAVMPFSIDAYLPAIPDMATALAVNIHRIEQSLSVFVFGVALGQLIGGPVSDLKGRKRVALAGLAVYLAATVGLVWVQTVEALLALRFVQAIGGGMATVTVAAQVRDRFEGAAAAQMFALIGIIMMAAPLAAPMLGALLKSLAGWRAVFVFLAVYAGLVGLLLLWRLPASTRPSRPFDRRFLPDIAANYQRVFRQPQALGFLFFQAFSFAAMFAFLTESPFVYMTRYGLDEHQYSWAFGANIITMMLFNRITAWRLRHTDAKNILLSGIAVQFVCNLLLVAVVLLLDLPPFPLLLGLLMISIGTQGLIVANTQACYMAYFKQEGGSANAVLGTIQFLVGATVGWLTTQAHNGSVLVMPAMMLASTVCGMLLLWVLSRKVWTAAA